MAKDLGESHNIVQNLPAKILEPKKIPDDPSKKTLKNLEAS